MAFYPPGAPAGGAATDQVARDAAAAAQTTANAAVNTDSELAALIPGPATAAALAATNLTSDTADTASQAASILERVQRVRSPLDYIASAKRPAVFKARTGSDVTTELQAFINYCRDNSYEGEIDGGYYTISNGLTLNDTATPKTVRLRGRGRGYGSATGVGGVNSPVTIDATAVTTKPAIRGVNLRSSYLGNLTILGPNAAPGLIGTNEPTISEAGYVTAGVRDSRYSPQCAVCIDPNGGTTPPDGGYPGVTYTGGNGGSLDVVLEHLTLRNHVAGVMINPSNGGQQGDGVHVLFSRMENVKIGLAHGQSQSNVCIAQGVYVTTFHTAVDGLSYGVQQGAIPHIYTLSANFGLRVFNVPDGLKMGNCLGVYAESVKYLGNIGVGVSTQKLPFVMMNVGLHTRTDWSQVPWALFNSGPVQINGFDLYASPGDADVWNFGGVGPLLINTLEARMKDYFKPFVGWSRDWVKPIGGANWYVSSTSARSGSVAFNPPADNLSALPSRVDLHPSSNKAAGLGINYDVEWTANKNTYVSLAGSGAPTFDGAAKTISFTNTTNNALILVGDILLWRINNIAPVTGNELHFALKVTSNDGTTITCACLFDFSLYDQTYAPTSAFVACQQWAAGLSLKGDISGAGATTLTNVANAALLRVGDWIKAVGGLGLTRVTAISGTTVTVATAATSSQTQVLLFNAKLMTRTVAALFT